MPLKITNWNSLRVTTRFLSSNFKVTYEKFYSELNSYDKSEWSKLTESYNSNIQSYDSNLSTNSSSSSSNITQNHYNKKMQVNTTKKFIENIIGIQNSLSEIKSLHDNNEIENDVDAIRDCQDMLDELNSNYKNSLHSTHAIENFH